MPVWSMDGCCDWFGVLEGRIDSLRGNLGHYLGVDGLTGTVYLLDQKPSDSVSRVNMLHQLYPEICAMANWAILRSGFACFRARCGLFFL